MLIEAAKKHNYYKELKLVMEFYCIFFLCPKLITVNLEWIYNKDHEFMIGSIRSTREVLNQRNLITSLVEVHNHVLAWIMITYHLSYSHQTRTK